MSAVGTVDDGSVIEDRRAMARKAKRAFDVAVAIPLCVIAVPVIVLLAAVVAVQLRANPFFVHDRIGEHGQVVRIPKIRTLAATTPIYADKLADHLEAPTRFARALRRRHLDELPQLFLVPFGRLSLVGPRPMMAVEGAMLSVDQLELATSVPQGCTGLWQISHDQGSRVGDCPEYAQLYVTQRTLRLDLRILCLRPPR